MNLPLTDTASKALLVAQELATKHGHVRVGTTHILLALLQCGGVAGEVTASYRSVLKNKAEQKLGEVACDGS